jgi:Response regulator containing CheY-like receiver, AAA-type ATPase, and DNA-binding domains
VAAIVYRKGGPEPQVPNPGLDAHVFYHENDAVIASAISIPVDSTMRTILIVDDDRSVADTFARMLKLEGFGVATALSAEAGLELADNVQPQAIILDMRMPITNGLQFLRLVRSKPHLVNVPVAIVTGDYFLPESIQHELKSLGASIRFKPLWLEDLIALAKTLVSA